MAYRYSYRITEKAQEDFDGTITYIKDELSNPVAAEKFTIDLLSKIHNLTAFPESGGKIVNDFIVDKSLRKFNIGNYIVFYKPEKETETIIILRIVYGGRNIDEILKTI